MKFIIDRFEEDMAVVELEDGEMVDIPRQVLPRDAEEGDVLVIFIDIDETEARRRRIEDKFRNLFGKK